MSAEGSSKRRNFFARKPSIGINIRRRRAHSAPASMNRKKSMIEDYYNVDTDPKLVMLPGMPTYDEDWPRDLHDFFNLVILIPVIVLNGLNWNWEILLDFSSDKSYEAAWVGDWLTSFHGFAMMYFFIDLAWVVIAPYCVRSPVTIIVHHVFCLLYLSIPFVLKDTPYYIMGMNMSVEANTWFLIARRVFNKQGFPPWTISLPPIMSIRIKMISVCFYVTWFVIRLIIMPSVLFDLYYLWADLAEQTGNTFNFFLFALFFQVGLCVLNAKWTRDLIVAKIRFWTKGGKLDKAQSKGL